MAAIIYSGALERLPQLKIVIGEAGIGWIPYVLERLDYEWEDQNEQKVEQKREHASSTVPSHEVRLPLYTKSRSA